MALSLECLSRVDVAKEIEKTVERGVRRSAFLKTPHSPETGRRSFPSSEEKMRVFRSLVQKTTDLLAVGVSHLIRRCAIGPSPSGDDQPRRPIACFRSLKAADLSRLFVT